MKQKLLSLYVQIILDKRFITLRRSLTEFRRKLTFKKRVVSVFLQLDDPYSYLLSHYLQFVARDYKVDIRVYLCQALPDEFMPKPALLAEYAAKDCKLLAQELAIEFLDRGDTPVVEHRRALLDFLAGDRFARPGFFLIRKLQPSLSCIRRIRNRRWIPGIA